MPEPTYLLIEPDFCGFKKNKVCFGAAVEAIKHRDDSSWSDAQASELLQMAQPGDIFQAWNFSSLLVVGSIQF